MRKREKETGKCQNGMLFGVRMELLSVSKTKAPTTTTPNKHKH